MCQSHIAQFRSGRLKFPRNCGKSPSDFKLTVPEILAKSVDKPAEKVGPLDGTMSRHMIQMGSIATICEADGHPFADFNTG
jgi:hypothetical protein